MGPPSLTGSRTSAPTNCETFALPGGIAMCGYRLRLFSVSILFFKVETGDRLT